MTKTIQRTVFGLALAVSFAASGTAQGVPDSNGDGIARPNSNRTYLYTAKFLCLSAVGPGADSAAAFQSVQYITVLNILNKEFRPASMRVQAIGATQLNSGIPSPKAGVGSVIDSEQARFITCFDARRLAGEATSVSSIQFEGYIMIESDTPLEVDAVYSTLNINGPAGVQTSIDVEKVRATRRRRPTPIPTPFPLPLPMPRTAP